jgi:hypothetical protein
MPILVQNPLGDRRRFICVAEHIYAKIVFTIKMIQILVSKFKTPFTSNGPDLN